MAILGYNTQGGTQDYFSDYITLCKFTPNEDGTITAISTRAFKDFGGTANIRFAIYSDNGGVPDVLRAYTNVNTLVTTTLDWYSGTSFVEAVTDGLDIQNGVPVWLALMNDDPYTVAAYIDAGATNQLYLENPAFTTWNWPATLSTPQAQLAFVLSIYADYTPASTVDSRSPFTYLGGTYIGASQLEFSGDVEVTPSAISVEMNVISPVVTGDSDTAPSAISSELNVISPIVTADVDVIPTTISNELNVIDPVVTGDSDFTPVVISSVINVISPVVSGDSNIEVSVISATLNVISPTVTSEIEVLASVIEAELNSISPVVTGDAETIPSVISVEMNSISPLVTGDSNVSVSTISTNLSVISPIVFSDVDIAAESINVSLNINLPSVTGDSDTDVNVISANLRVISPLVIGDSNTNISTISALLNVLIPIVTNGETTYYAALRYWNGSSYQKGVVRVRINGVWVRKQIRLRLDNEWKLIDCNG